MYCSTRPLVRCLAFLALSVGLNADIVFTSGPSNQDDGLDMSEFIVADNFLLSSATTALTAATFFASADVDPFPSQFSGTVGWAFFQDNGGTPGIVVGSGIDSSPNIIDTGKTILGTEEWAIGFTIPSLELPSGRYWLGLHESAFGTPDDGSSIYWDTTSNQSTYPAMVTADLSGATGWIQGDGSNLAFELVGSEVPNPSTSPEPGILLPLGLLLCAIRVVRMKRAMGSSDLTHKVTEQL